MSSIFSKIVTGSAWVTGARLLTNCLGLISTVVLARHLVPADFGLVAIAITMLAIVSSITNISLAEALIQNNNLRDYHFDTVWSFEALRGATIAVLYAACAPLAASVFHEPRLTSVMSVLAVGIFVSGLANPRRIILQKSLVFRQEFLLKILEKITAVIVTIALAVIYKSYWSLVLGSVIGQLASMICSYIILPYRPRVGFKGARELFGFSIWVSLGQVMNTVNWKLDQLLVGKIIGANQLGLYTVGDNLAVMPTREATQPLTGTLYPAFSHLAKEPRRLCLAYQSAQTLATAIALPLGFGMALLAHPLVLSVLGPKWVGAIIVIQGLSGIFALQTIGALVQPLGMALARTRTLFLRDALMFCVRVPIIVIGLIGWGLEGIVVARIITGLISIMINLMFVRDLIGISLLDQLRVNWRAVTAVAIMAIVILSVRHVTGSHWIIDSQIMVIALYSLLGAATYCGATFLLWRLAGCPDGPEGAIKKIAGAFLVRVKKSCQFPRVQER